MKKQLVVRYLITHDDAVKMMKKLGMKKHQKFNAPEYSFKLGELDVRFWRRSHLEVLYPELLESTNLIYGDYSGHTKGEMPVFYFEVFKVCEA